MLHRGAITALVGLTLGSAFLFGISRGINAPLQAADARTTEERTRQAEAELPHSKAALTRRTPYKFPSAR